MQEHSGESFSFSSDQGASVAAWLEYVIDSMTDSSLPFSRYVRSTFTPAATPPPRASDKELFPCPPPFPWSCDKGPLQGRSRRRAARFRFRRSIELWTNLMVCALSHQALGVQVAPEQGRRECKLNQAQEEMVHFLLKLSRSMVRLGTSESGCGLRLPAVGTHLSELRSELDALDSLPYARHKRQFGESSQGAAFAATKALPVVADRLSLPDQVENFDPRPYLSEKFRTIFEDPDTLLKTPEDMPPPIHIKGTASRTELLKVFARWDQLERLFVCKTDEVNFLDRCELFAVAKDVDRDRQILHRKRRNRREYHVVGESRNLPHAVLLTQLPLGRDLVCACSVDDIRDFYHAYVATEKRARSSPVGPSFRWGEVAHLKAAQAALAANRITTGDRLVCCFKGLGMGDHAAVDIAQESHVNLLRSWGTFLPEETLNYRHPLPKPESGYYEGIMIDDHLGVQLLPWKGDEVTTLAQEGRDQQVFEAATAAYNSVDLRTHEGKKVRRSLHTKVWGAEIEGKAGLIGPSRCKLLRLAQLSVSMAKSGPVDQKLVEAITGLWAFNLQFRRPLFAFMYDIYHQLSPGGPEDLFKLTQGARNELMVLASCAPLCVCDARALPDSFLYCVDASPSGAGVCRAEVGIEVSGELWRRGDKVGYQMPLLSRLQSSLKGSGWDEEAVLSEEESTGDEGRGSAGVGQMHGSLEVVFEHRVMLADPSLALFEFPFDLLEVYAGGAQMSRAWKAKGFKVLPPLEVKQGWDLLDPEWFFGLLSFVRAGKVRFLWWAPPGATFSSSQAARVRSAEAPWGLDVLADCVVKGNLHACQCALLALVQVTLGLFMAGEVAATSLIRALGAWRVLSRRENVFEVLFDWCRFGRNFRKTTCLISNFVPLKKLGRRCCHHNQRKHLVLNGGDTTNAAAYSEYFCDRVASLWKAWEHSHAQPFWEDGVGDIPYNAPFLDQSSLVQDADFCLKPFGDSGRRRPKGGSALWAVQLSEGLTWKPWVQYEFRQKEHINLQETKARRTLFKRIGRDKRLVVAQDSRVNIGSLGKGRSPSAALNRLLRSEAPFLLGKNLHVASIHFPTWSLRADGPSRGRKVLGARTPLPKWFWALRQGSRQAASKLDGLQGLSRALNRWYLFVGVLLLSASGSAAAPSSSPSRSLIDRKRQDHRADSKHSTRAAQQTGNVVGRTASGHFSGALGTAPHRCFVRVARRIYGHLVSGGSKPSLRGGESQCGGPTIWLASILSCCAVECAEDVGYVGASDTPPTNAFASRSCACKYCSGLELAAFCGPAGHRLFWLTETLRACWLATTRPVTSTGPLGTASLVRSNRPAEDALSCCNGAARAHRRNRRCCLGTTDPGLNADVEKTLVWFCQLLQDSP